MARDNCGMNPKKPRPLCLAGCKREVPRPSYKYCSNKCQMAYQHQIRVAVFLRGEYPVVECTGATSFVRHWLIETYGEQCARCGWRKINPSTGRSPLEVEHIDGDSENMKPENLILLCPNCHSLTDTFKALNKGRGRERRKLRRNGVAVPIKDPRNRRLPA